MERLKVWDPYDTVMELWELRSLHEDALVVYAHLLLGCKDSEVSGTSPLDADTTSADLFRWKARLVAGGNALLDSCGVHYREENLYGSPTSLEAVRFICWWAVMNPIHTLVQSDVHGAYLQSNLGGRPVWLVLPPLCWPASWRGKYKQPVLRLRKAMYGLQRSGFDWAKRAHSVLSKHGWVLVPDVIDCVYMLSSSEGICVLALYVDDILASGPESMLLESLAAISRD